MPAQPPLGSSPEVTPEPLPLGFLHLLHPLRLIMDLLRIPGACYVAVNDLEKQRPEGVNDNGDLVLRYLHKGHN